MNDPDNDAFGLDAASVESIVTHMNEDHADAVAACARAFGGAAPEGRTRMTDIDRHGIVVACDETSGTRLLRLDFPEPLASAAAARRALVEMTRRAREKLSDDGPDA